MYRSKFRLPELGDTSFEGLTDGSTWNGWATPLFDFDVGTQIVAGFNKLQWLPKDKAWFDSERDQFCFLMEGQAEPERFSSEIIDIGDRQIKAYPIGTRVWVWEESSEINH